MNTSQRSREEFFEELFREKPLAPKEWKLETMLCLLKDAGLYPLAYPSIHVGGTNGKGQVSTKIARAFEYEGYKVGLYTSPHLERYEERIVINQEEISFEALLEYDNLFCSICKKRALCSTFFERTTFYAFCHFALCNVDLAVFEVGIGGRLDATNVLSPVLAVITSISMDHQDLLGDTLEDIAIQKGGMIKENTPVVLGATAALAPLLTKAKKCNAPVFIASSHPLYEQENRLIAQSALEILCRRGMVLSEEAIEKGLQAQIPCRFEKVDSVIFDVAHNIGGFQALKRVLKREQISSYQVLIGMCRDKDVEGCLREICEEASHIYVVESTSCRAAPFSLFEAIFQKLHYKNYSLEPSIKQGMEKGSHQGQLLLVCGSFYIMDGAKAALKEIKKQTRSSLLPAYRE